MADVSILIPYGNETSWRKCALEHVEGWYEDTLEDAEILLGPGGEPWCKARAVAHALAGSTAPVVVIADADCIAPGITQAVRAVQQGAAWAMPHLKVYRMSQTATREIFRGAPPGSLTGQNRWLDQSPYKGYEGGGITVLRRDVYLQCPLDPAFRGWGQEDEAWALALNALHGPPWRAQGPLYHLWHEKPARVSRYAGSEESVARLAQYKEAQIHGSWDELLEDSRRTAGAVSVAQ